MGVWNSASELFVLIRFWCTERSRSGRDRPIVGILLGVVLMFSYLADDYIGSIRDSE
jgi:hypothetical protein